jgi:hypothetical protein
MKKTIFTLALASAFGIAGAQNLKPAAGTMGFTGGLAGGITQAVSAGPSKTGSLQFKYYIAEGLAARVGFNVTVPSGNGTTVSDTSGSGQKQTVYQTTTIKSGGTTTAISLGIQKSLGGTDKLDVYTGADFYLAGTTSKVTDKKDEAVFITANSTSNKPGDFKQSVQTFAPGGMTIGLNGFVGFQYFLVEKLSLGTEFAYGYFYNSSNNGSTATVNTATTNGVVGNTPATGASTVISNPAVHTGVHGLGVAGSSITLSFYF